MKLVAVMLAMMGALLVDQARGDTPLLLERKIPLGEVRGRIDHLAVDLQRNHLFVAELESDAVAVVDLDANRLLHVISDLHKPQGLGYDRATDTLYVANGGDGTVAVFRGNDFSAVARIAVGEDADNVRVDALATRVYVAYRGGLAVIDPANRSKLAYIDLRTHPEGFQLDPSGNQIFLNDPASQAIIIADRDAQKELGRWSLGNGTNFPMALNPKAGHVVVAFRNPARLAAFSKTDGARVFDVELCGDADDVFVDQKRERVYVSCGEGYLDVFDARQAAYRRIRHVATAAGARTSLFVPELDLLFVAARATASEPASLWVFRPNDAIDESLQ
jgi:DNA-binding beta-propeller fold protein YncE